ncbi:MAG: phosphatase PAP2 family protein, partial [Planctomycetota bacterium]
QTLDDTWRLSTLVPRIHAKDTSPWSFPGDHGFVLLSVALYVSMFRARRTARWTWLVSIILILPRLIAGAHWTTDILIGSGAMALVTIGLLMATPVHDVFMRLLSGEYFEIREQPRLEALPYYKEDALESDVSAANENEPLRRAA